MPGIPRNLNTFVSSIPAHTPEEVFEQVAETWKIDAEIIKGRSRKGDAAIARHAVAYIIRHKFELLSTTDIGKIMDRNHSSVLHSCKVFKNLWDTDKNVRQKIIGTI